MKIINDFEQGSQEWLSFKAGKFSGSEIHSIMGVKGLGDTGISYIKKKVGEILAGQIQETATTFAMLRGKEVEPLAVKYFEKATSLQVEKAGLFQDEKNPNLIYSPDGFYRIEGKGFTLIEIKCPETFKNHVDYLMLNNGNDLKECKKEYYWQIQYGLMISDFERANFISFHPDFSPEFRMVKVLIERNKNDINLLKNRLKEATELKEQFLSEIYNKIKKHQ